MNLMEAYFVQSLVKFPERQNFREQFKQIKSFQVNLNPMGQKKILRSRPLKGWEPTKNIQHCEHIIKLKYYSAKTPSQKRFAKPKTESDLPRTSIIQ